MLLVSDKPWKRKKSYKDFDYGQKEMMQFKKESKNYEESQKWDNLF